MLTPLRASHSAPIEGGPSFSLRNRIFRALWQLTWLLLCRWTPPFFYKWRILVLRVFGANVDSSARVYGSAKIWYPPNLMMAKNSCLGPGVNCYCMALIGIGESSIVSQGAQLCAGTHDIRDPNFQLITKPITIGSQCWIAADAFVGPGVTIGNGVVIGARGVLFKNADNMGVYVGNPAVLIKKRTFVR